MPVQKMSARPASIRYAPQFDYRPATPWPQATQSDSTIAHRVLWMWLAGGLGVATMFVIVAAIIMAWGTRLYRSDMIMPGVQALGARLGGLSTAQATLLLEQRWSQQTIILQAGDIAYAVNPAMLGISLEAGATARAAIEYGRSLDRLPETTGAIAGKGILPIVKLDPIAAENNLKALAPRFEARPVNAGVRIADGRAEIAPPVAGQVLDVPATVEHLKLYAAQAIRDGHLALVTTPLQPAINDVRAIHDLIAQLPVAPLAVRAFDPVLNQVITTTIAPEVWTAWLVVMAKPHESNQLYWRVEPDKAKSLTAILAPRVGAERYLKSDEAALALEKAIQARKLDVSVRIYHHPRQHTVQPGETLTSIARDYGLPYPWIQQANPARGNALTPGQALTIPSPDVLLPLPVIENKRILISLSQQKLWAYENGAIKWEWPVSTGIASSPTWPGAFQIQSHAPNAYAANWDLTMPYFLGIYRPAPDTDFMNGFHGFPARNGSQVLWTNSLGKPVTYGCILVSTDNAALLFKWAEEGVVVEIRP